MPATFTVTTPLDTVAADGKMSLREAISAANAHPGTDTIVLHAGVYRLTRTDALLAGSPAIDHGDNTLAPIRDQRGVLRARDGDGNGSRIVDIGAFER